MPFAPSNVALPSNEAAARRPAEKISAVPAADEEKAESVPGKPVNPEVGQQGNR